MSFIQESGEVFTDGVREIRENVHVQFGADVPVSK